MWKRLKRGARRLVLTAPQQLPLSRNARAEINEAILIFVVDDENVIADTLCAILRRSGFDSRAFYDAETALTACENERPDFVITDVSMPGMSGVEMAVQIKDRMPGCGVLLFSGHAGTLAVLEAARRRGYDFELLTKPMHPKDLIAKLKGLIPEPRTALGAAE